MPRYAALLRGVAPSIVKNADLQRAFEAAGFAEVRTVLSSGNVVFTARAAAAATLERRAERAMQDALGRSFFPIVRPLDLLHELLAADPWAALPVPAGAKRVVTFLREPPTAPPALPVARDGAQILALRGAEALSAYLPSPNGPAFMTLIERTLGTDVTTRTWETVGKIARVP